MNFSIKFHFFTSFIVVIFLSCADEESSQLRDSEQQPIFTLLDSEQTNINFSNTLTEGPNTNILMYEYFYNGGGVAIGDLNGDNFDDLYFTANMSENKLYLNKGKLNFEDITKLSGAGGRSGPWKTGVSMVDINADGKLDIYLCYSGSMPTPKRANQLFINQGNDENGNPVFLDQAEQFGLASTSFSNQSYFFDADNDGDLDMFLLNHNPKNLPILNEQQTKVLFAKDSPMMGSRLFIQNNGKFEDATIQAGINGSELSYGLGAGLADINQDGWTDIYVSNDYAVPDYLYINNKDGTFSNLLSDQIRYTSHFSMGNDVADINNDGFNDIVSLDMLPEDNTRQKKLLAPDNYAKFDLHYRSGFYYQFMRNMLQLNNGNGTFSEIGQLSGISNTDWSWSALLADYDNDGLKDLYVTNGYNRDYTNLDFINYMDDYVKQKGRLIRQDVLQIINRMPASNIVNYLFKNINGIHFEDQTLAWGLSDISNSNGAAYGDLDNDGDLDIVVNNINKHAFIYENEINNNSNNYLQFELKGEDKNVLGIGAKIRVVTDNNVYFLEQNLSRGYLSSVSPTLHLGLGTHKKVDSLIIDWTSGKSETQLNINTNQRITLLETDAIKKQKINKTANTYFKQISSPIQYSNPKLSARDFDRQPLLMEDLSCEGPQFLKADINNDNLYDLIIAGAKNQAITVCLQTNNASFRKVESPAFMIDSNSEDTDMISFYANADNHLDLYVTSGGYHDYHTSDSSLQDRLYFGNGDGTFIKSDKSIPTLASSHSCVVAYDFNNDSFEDLFIGGAPIPGRYPESSQSILLINDGDGNFTVGSGPLVKQLEELKLVTDAAVSDLNKDGIYDLIVVGKWMPINIFQYSNEVLQNKTSEYFNTAYNGLWNTIHIADVNEDNRPDLIIGNQGLNNQFTASESEPLDLHYADFDKNGSLDPIFSYYIQGKSYPHLTRDELNKQLPQYKTKFTSYEEYSHVVLDDLFSKEEIKNAGHLKATHLETSLFIQNENGIFMQSPLPHEAQYSPIYAITTMDINKDGLTDILMMGNNSRSTLRLGHSSANYGTLFEATGNDNYKYISQHNSGLDLRGDIRDIAIFKDVIFLGANQNKLVSYQLTN